MKGGKSLVCKWGFHYSQFPFRIFLFTSPEIAMGRTLTSVKSVPWSVPSFSGRRNYFADAPGASGTLRGTLFPCVGRSFHGTLFPWDGRSRGTLFSGLHVLSLYGRTSGPSYFMRTPPEVVGLRGLNMVSGACKYCHNIKE